VGEINRISSFKPRKKMITAEPIKYCRPGFSEKEDKVETEIIKAAKMPTPPSDGTGVKCTFRTFGMSKIFRLSAILITTGIAVKATINETREANRTKPIEIV
jgi:hypothetical protein